MLQVFLLALPGYILVLATKFGIDVSRHQKYIQWHCMLMNGIDWIILPCSEALNYIIEMGPVARDMKAITWHLHSPTQQGDSAQLCMEQGAPCMMESQHQQGSIILLEPQGLSSVHHPRFMHQMQSPPSHMAVYKKKSKRAGKKTVLRNEPFAVPIKWSINRWGCTVDVAAIYSS